MQTTCRTQNIPTLQVQKGIGLTKFSGFDSMNTKILLLLNVLFCLMIHTGCGTIHRHDAEKKLETLYATEVTFENRFRLQVFSDAQPGQEENIYNMNAGSRSVEFWHDFELYQDKFGKQHALAQLEKMVRVNGLCMIMAYEYGQRLVGEAAFSQMIKLGGDEQTRFYRFATADNDFKAGHGFLKRKQCIP